jgi:hypothetical protein
MKKDMFNNRYANPFNLSKIRIMGFPFCKDYAGYYDIPYLIYIYNTEFYNIDLYEDKKIINPNAFIEWLQLHDISKQVISTFDKLRQHDIHGKDQWGAQTDEKKINYDDLWLVMADKKTNTRFMADKLTPIIIPDEAKMMYMIRHVNIGSESNLFTHSIIAKTFAEHISPNFGKLVHAHTEGRTDRFRETSMYKFVKYSNRHLYINRMSYYKKQYPNCHVRICLTKHNDEVDFKFDALCKKNKVVCNYEQPYSSD